MDYSSYAWLDTVNEIAAKKEKKLYDELKRTNYIREVRLPKNSKLTEDMVKFIIEEHIKRIPEDDYHKGIFDLKSFLSRNRDFLNKFKKVDIKKSDPCYKTMNDILQKIEKDWMKLRKEAEQQANDETAKMVKDYIQRIK